MKVFTIFNFLLNCTTTEAVAADIQHKYGLEKMVQMFQTLQLGLM